MFQLLFKPLAASAFLLLVHSLAGCQGTGHWVKEANHITVAEPTATSASAAAPVSRQSSRTSASPVTTAAADPDPYQLAIDRASSAVSLSQLAASKDDWWLIANRWQQAIDLMSVVPMTHPQRQLARQKVTEYQRYRHVAEQRANRPVLDLPQTATVKSPKTTTTPATATSAPATIASTPSATTISTTTSATPPRQTRSLSTTAARAKSFVVPIVRRAGNTPVIQVQFNSGRAYDMIVDTGASVTLITQPMAAELRVASVGETRIDTASAQGVSFSQGYVQSMAIDGIEAKNVLVTIASPELTLGLLGHDFFGNYDVTIREHEVEFQERS